MNNFKLRTWHFGVMLAILILAINVLGHLNLEHVPNIKDKDVVLKTISKDNFKEHIQASKICFVLFSKDNSESSCKMEHNLYQMHEIYQDSLIDFWKIDAEENFQIVQEYNILGTPSVIIFKNGKEVKRIMGVVSLHNLKFIYNRII